MEAAASDALVPLSAAGDTPASTSLVGVLTFLASRVLSPRFFLDWALFAALPCAFYLLISNAMAFLFPRAVPRDVYKWDSLKSDAGLALTTLFLGTPLNQIWMMLDEEYHFTRAYHTIDGHPGGWAYWALSIPVYVLLWDFLLYATHVALHIPGLYESTHAAHHSFRPPTAYSSVAVAWLEAVIQGQLPFLLPVCIIPFHFPTAYSLQLVLTIWSSFIHSSSHWQGSWLLITPMDHNLHHERGRMNGNFGAITTIWDRVFGTLIRDLPPEKMPYWIVKEKAERKEKELGLGLGLSEPATPTTTAVSSSGPAHHGGVYRWQALAVASARSVARAMWEGPMSSLPEEDEGLGVGQGQGHGQGAGKLSTSSPTASASLPSAVPSSGVFDKAAEQAAGQGTGEGDEGGHGGGGDGATLPHLRAPAAHATGSGTGSGKGLSLPSSGRVAAGRRRRA